MKKNDGFLSYKDLADHHSDWVEPVSTNYRGYDVWETSTKRAEEYVFYKC